MARPAEGWRLRKHRRRYFVRFTHEGERVELPTGTGDPEEAARRAAKLYADHHSGKHRARPRLTDPKAPIIEVAARWIADIEHELDPETIATMMVYARHFGAFFESMSGLTAANCARYSRERLRRVKRKTVQKELSALRRFLGWCEEQGIMSGTPKIVSPPRRALGTPFATRRRGTATLITPDEAMAIIAELPEWSTSRKTKPFPIRARFVFAWETALRPSTIDLLSVPEHFSRGASVLIVTDEI